jgi:hypothetical protein
MKGNPFNHRYNRATHYLRMLKVMNYCKITSNNPVTVKIYLKKTVQTLSSDCCLDNTPLKRVVFRSEYNLVGNGIILISTEFRTVNNSF